MSLVTHNNVPFTRSLEIALSEIGSVLTDEERKQLQHIKAVPDDSAALVFTAKLDASNSKRRGKSIGARAYSMLRSIQQFSGIVEVFVSSNPTIAALFWGSIKLTLLIAANITSYFESLADLFMSLNKLFPRFDEYQVLFPQSESLRETICTFHASFVQLCKQIVMMTRQPWIKKVTSDLRSRLQPGIANIETCSEEGKMSIALAAITSQRKEQEFQEEERKLAVKDRKQFSAFAFQSKKDLEHFTEWQLRRNRGLLSRFPLLW